MINLLSYWAKVDSYFLVGVVWLPLGVIFKTGSNYLKEYVRCWSVYGLGSLVNFVCLPIIVEILQSIGLSEEFSPYIGGTISSGLVVVISFLGHKNITYRV